MKGGEWKLSDNSRNSWLDFCRTLAILLVLASHGRYFLISFMPKMEILRFGGFFGVELFFILSGFLIGRILINEVNKSETAYSWVKNFLLRRWLRTLPNYYLFIVINILLHYYAIRSSENFVPLKYFFMVQNLFVPHPDFFIEAWSLAIEEIFYLLMPITIGTLFLLKREKRKIIPIVACLIFIISFFFRFVVVNITDYSFNQVRSTVFLRLDSLMFGIVLAWFFVESSKMTFRKNYMYILFGIASLVFVFFNAIRPDSVLNKSKFLKIFLFPIASFAGVFIVSFGYEKTFSIKKTNLFRFLAKVSYSAYLVNMPILMLMKYWVKAPTNYIEGWLMLLLFVILTIFVSSLIFYCYEKKWLDLRNEITVEK